MKEPCDVDLWIGVPDWPAETGPEPWEGIGFEVLQVGGFFCHHHRFFGLKFQVPRLDPLATLACSYYGSDLPGGNEDHATPLEEIVRLRDRLEELGLTLDPVRFPDSADGYLPILAESAWRYVERQRLDPYLQPNTRSPANSFLGVISQPQSSRLELTTLRELGIFGWEDAKEYLEDFWLRCGATYVPRLLAVVS